MTGRPVAVAERPEGTTVTAPLELILARIRLRARRRVAWLQNLEMDPENSAREAPVADLTDRDSPDREAEWVARSGSVQSWNRELKRIEKELTEGSAGEPLRRLEALFHLSRSETDLFQLCIAIAVDPGLGPVYAVLQRHPARAYPTESLAARLFGYGLRPLWIDSSPLAVWRWVTRGDAPAGEPSPLACDPLAREWLAGCLTVDPLLVGAVRQVQSQEPLESWPVEELEARVRKTLDARGGVRVLLSGPRGCGRRTLAVAVAGRLGLSTLAVDTGQIAVAEWEEAFIRAQRLAILAGAAVVWHGPEVGRPWPAEVAPAPVQFVACEDHESLPPLEHVVDHRAVVSSPTLDERRALWARQVPSWTSWPPAEREALVARHRLSVGEIAAVGQRVPATVRSASDLCRELTRHRLGDLGRLLDCPFTWDDLVVPDALREALEDFVFEAKDRVAFWEAPSVRRLFPRGTALVGLLTGPPGTGKTMASQVMAADLELDLFRIDLATVVSKYIGETAKNLQRIFAQAVRMDAVLLFDEADALFSRRTEVKDAHDRYANTDTNYLLQLLEEYRGVALLATNRKGNIDPAFTRRLRYLFDFPRPTPELRRRLWHRVVGEMCGEETLRRLTPVLDSLSRDVSLSGAQIKNAVLAALFIARRRQSPLGMTHLLGGIDRELGKEGRSVGRGERERLVGSAHA